MSNVEQIIFSLCPGAQVKLSSVFRSSVGAASFVLLQKENLATFEINVFNVAPFAFRRIKIADQAFHCKDLGYAVLGGGELKILRARRHGEEDNISVDFDSMSMRSKLGYDTPTDADRLIRVIQEAVKKEIKGEGNV